MISSCISLDTFNSVSDFIITKDQLCGTLMRVAVGEIEIVGYPVQISSHDYMRNAFNFNICFIVKKGSSSQYESMVKKVAMTFESLERQNGFLQSPTILVCIFSCFSFNLVHNARHFRSNPRRLMSKKQL